MTELPVFESHDGTKWLNRGGETDDHLAHGLHEAQYAPTFWQLVQAVPEDGWVCVVGAHVGTWAVRFARERHVLAFEANPDTMTTLIVNAELNGVLDSMTLVQRAVWSVAGDSLGMVDENGKAEGGSTRVGGTGDILTTTLDAERHYRPRIGFVLMDVEGAEGHVLRGARQLLEIDRPFLSIELHEGHVGVDENIREQVERVLTEYSYHWRSEIVDSEEHLVCWPVEQNDPTVSDFIPEGVDEPIG